MREKLRNRAAKCMGTHSSVPAADRLSTPTQLVKLLAQESLQTTQRAESLQHCSQGAGPRAQKLLSKAAEQARAACSASTHSAGRQKPAVQSWGGVCVCVCVREGLHMCACTCMRAHA